MPLDFATAGDGTKIPTLTRTDAAGAVEVPEGLACFEYRGTPVRRAVEHSPTTGLITGVSMSPGGSSSITIAMPAGCTRAVFHLDNIGVHPSGGLTLTFRIQYPADTVGTPGAIRKSGRRQSTNTWVSTVTYTSSVADLGEEFVFDSPMGGTLETLFSFGGPGGALGTAKGYWSCG